MLRLVLVKLKQRQWSPLLFFNKRFTTKEVHFISPYCLLDIFKIKHARHYQKNVIFFLNFTFFKACMNSLWAHAH